ncbi:hypothetical protein PRZ48_002448 [Zasmidium cellare]|uniref:Uncharacterized protein n=1 Tax=Zasmidium cellare TaxID=395010 RepID=A0ABR0F5F6_ZASCE|nr:hypothetical protein PRZ48_002448 [Zasmidium cellare]
MPRIGSKRIAGHPRGDKAEKANEEVPTTLVQLDTLGAKMQLHGHQSNSKRKRAASPSSDTDPLSLRGFQTPLASREKQESNTDVADIPAADKAAKPPAKKMRAQSPDGSAEITPLDALEMALQTPMANGTSGNPIEFESDDGQDVPMADRDDPAHEGNVAPLSKGAVQEIKPAKTKKQLKAEQKQLKAERRAAEEARIEAKKQLKAERKAAEGARLNAKKSKKEIKEERQIEDMKAIMQTWPKNKLKNHVQRNLQNLAVRKLKESGDLALVLNSLQLALKAVECEQKKMDQAAAAEQDGGKAPTAMDNWLNKENPPEAEVPEKELANAGKELEKTATKKANKQAKKARKQAEEQAREKKRQGELAKKVDAEAKIIEKELEELSKKIKKEKIDGVSSKKIKKEKADGGVKIKKEVMIKQEPREWSI